MNLIVFLARFGDYDILQKHNAPPTIYLYACNRGLYPMTKLNFVENTLKNYISQIYVQCTVKNQVTLYEKEMHSELDFKQTIQNHEKR